MVTSISARHLNISAKLKEHVNKKIDSGIKNYLNNITQCHVTFSKESFLYHVNIIIHDTVIGFVKANSENDDIFAAFDHAIMKIEKQLRKYHQKIFNKIKHSHEIKPQEQESIAKKYVVAVTPSDYDESVDELIDDAQHEPVTIAEKTTHIAKLTLSEAIMKMDLENLPALLFKNKNTNRFNIIYYRADGNISWIDPESNF